MESLAKAREYICVGNGEYLDPHTGKYFRITSLSDLSYEHLEPVINSNEWNYIFITPKTSIPSKRLETWSTRIQVIRPDELSIWVKGHMYLPRHFRRLSNEEKRALDQQYNLEKCPLQLETDPMSRFYGFVPGDVIEITRSDGTLYYRRIV